MARNEAVGKARYELETDPTKLKKGLDDAGRTIKRTGADTEKAFAQQSTGAVSKFGTALKGLDDRLVGMTRRGGISGAILGGVGLGAGLSVFNTVQNLVSGALDKVGQGIELASDKAEAASKANEIFGKSYGIVEAASRNAATTVGMSSGAYLTAAGNVGNLITNLGFAGDEAARMSRDIVKLSADVGSFNNAGTDEVVEAIGAAFRGETEPIRRFGVMLSAAKVEAKALAMGLKDGKKPLDDNAKATATYQLILEQTAKAQGDFARTSDQKANKDRIAAARQEEALTRLGEAILPLATELIPALADAGTAAVEVLTALVGATKSLWAVVGDVNEFFKPWEKEARLAKEQVAAWADELERMPEAAGSTRTALEGIAARAREAGTGLAGAKEELIDLARWTAAIALSGNQLPGMLRNFENWTKLLEAGTITTAQFDAKVRAMTRAGLGELRDNLDLLPPALRRVVLAIDSGQDAVDRFVEDWREASTLAIRSGDWERFSAFLVSNADLIRDHFDQLPADVQKAMLASGIVARQQLGDWAGTIAQVYQTQLVNSMQGFWAGPGATAMQPPGWALTPSPETLALVAATGREVAGALRLDFSGTARKGMSGAFRFIENNLGPGLKGTILSARKDVDDAMDEVRWVINHPKKWAKAVDDTEGAIKKLLRQRDKALREGNQPLARYLEGQAGMFISNWEELTGVAWDESLSVGENFAKGLRRKKPEVKGAAEELTGAARGPIKTLTSQATNYGTNYGKNIAAGMRSQVSAVRDAAGALARAGANQNRISSPAKEGPWSLGGGPEGWGRRYGLMIAQGMRSARTDVAMASAQLAGAAPSLAGWTMTADARRTIHHEHGGRVQVELSGSTIAAAREQGASWDDVGRMAAAGAGGFLRNMRQRASLPIETGIG